MILPTVLVSTLFLVFIHFSLSKFFSKEKKNEQDFVSVATSYFFSHSKAPGINVICQLI